MTYTYQARTTWRLDGSPAEITAILDDFTALPRWWPSVYLTVREIEPGGPDGVGRRIDMHTTGWLPYTLRWTSTLTEPVSEAGFAIAATGDFVGAGSWIIEPTGAQTQVSFDWRVQATKPILRWLGWLIRPVFYANHRWAMARGEESMQLELRRRRGETDVPAPRSATFRWLPGR